MPVRLNGGVQKLSKESLLELGIARLSQFDLMMVTAVKWLIGYE
jgi:hypothetical protein